MKKSIYLLIIVFTAIIFTGCQSKKALSTDDFSKAEVGMSAKEVTAVLGKPDEIRKNLESKRVAEQLTPFLTYVDPMQDKIEGGDELVEQLDQTLETIKDNVAITYYVYNYQDSSKDEETSVTMVFCDDELTLKLVEENFQSLLDTEMTE